MNIEEIILRKITPVVINSFNQPTYLKNIVNKFVMNKFINIFVLDNGSTYQPLIDLYQQLSDKGITILYYNQNRGPRYFHTEEIYKKYLGMIPHVYTDPDIDFDSSFFHKINFATK